MDMNMFLAGIVSSILDDMSMVFEVVEVTEEAIIEIKIENFTIICFYGDPTIYHDETAYFEVIDDRELTYLERASFKYFDYTCLYDLKVWLKKIVRYIKEY